MTGAMAARLAFALIAAVCGGAWLWRAAASRHAGGSRSSKSTPTEELDPPGGEARTTTHQANPEALPGETAAGNRVKPTLRAIVIAWCGIWGLIWLRIALVRIRYPFELEWSGGAMRDHCERILAGRLLYVPPGPDWFPFEYPPLYFYVSAVLMRLLHDGSFVSMRLVSLLSTLGCCAVLALWIRRAAPGPSGLIWGWIAAGIFLASYRFTGAWYDIERLDMLFLFLSLLGGYWLTRASSCREPAGIHPHAKAQRRQSGAGLKSLLEKTICPPSRTESPVREGGHDVLKSRDFSPEADRGRELNTVAEWAQFAFVILSVLAFWLAFLTKQQAVLFLFGSACALAWQRQWAKLFLFSALSALLCLGSVALLNHATDGWFGYYCFRVPLANGIRLNLAAQYFITDLPLYAPLIALCIISGLTLRLPRIPCLAWAFMGLLGSFLSRAHWGGDQNVLMAGFLGILLVAGVQAARMEAFTPRSAVPLYALALLQMLALIYRPDAQIPGPTNRAAAERYGAAVRTLEREGEVLCLDHGGVTATRHFHLMGMMDVIGTEKGMPPAMVAALRSHRYAAILSDARPEPGGAFAELTRDYQVAECLRIDAPWIATGFPTPGPGRQVWVLRPKR